MGKKKDFILFGIKTRTKKQNLTITMHTCNEYTLGIPSKKKKNQYHLFLIRKVIYPVYSGLLAPAFKDKGKMGKKKRETDRHKLVFFCLQNK